MRSLRATLAVAVLAALASSGTVQAVTLVTPQGKPLGGQWQRWASESKVPTAPVRVVFDSHPSDAGCPHACSIGPPFYGKTYEIWAASRHGLYFELGHVFDWAVLTWRRRGLLAHAWGVYGHPWLDSAQSDQTSGEDGAEVDFAAIYSNCAVGIDDLRTSVAMFAPSGTSSPPATYSTVSTCRYLKHFATR